MAVRPFKYVPFEIRGSVNRVIDRIQELNYRYEIYRFRRSEFNMAYIDFHLTPPDRPLLLERLIEDTSSGDVVYDVGANIGRYSIPLALQECEVHSFEPHPETYDKLTKNIRVNGIEDVECYNVGLSNSQGELTFYQSSNPTFSSFNEYNAEYGSGEIVAETRIETITIDNLVRENGVAPPTHIKIDVEGLGFEVLKGGRWTIENHKPNVYLELHKIDDSEDRREDEVREFFEELEYEIEETDYPWVCKPIS